MLELPWSVTLLLKGRQRCKMMHNVSVLFYGYHIILHGTLFFTTLFVFINCILMVIWVNYDWKLLVYHKTKLRVVIGGIFVFISVLCCHRYCFVVFVKVRCCEWQSLRFFFRIVSFFLYFFFIKPPCTFTS